MVARVIQPLPLHVQRNFVPTPDGELELLISRSNVLDLTSPPTVVTHGGCGPVAVWLEWIAYFHTVGPRVPIHSVHNHSAGFPVPNLNMTYRPITCLQIGSL